MKPNNLPSFAQSLCRRGVQVAVLGAAAFAAQVACSDNVASPGNTPQTFGGTSAGGTPSTAGTPATTAGAAGTPGASGTFTSGGTFGSAGTTTGGVDMGGTGGAAAGTGGAAAGTGGTPPTPVAYCADKTLTPLPYTVNPGFQPSGWGPDAAGVAEIKVGTQITVNPPEDACAVGKRSAGAVGDCTMWRYTPDPTTPTYAFVAWSTQYTPTVAGPPVCLAAGAKAITFMAKGAVGGEVVSFGGAGVKEIPFTLTADWKLYSIPLDGVEYNTFDKGVPSGFVWKGEPAVPAVLNTTFFVDSIQIVKDLPVGGGEGGAGGAP